MRTGVTVRELARTEAGFAVVVGPTTAPERIEADAVVLGHPGRADRPAPRRGGARGRGRAGRDRVRLGGRGHAGVPRGRRPWARRLLRFPGAAGRRPRDQGLDVLVRQVGLGARGRRRARTGAPAHLAGPARRGGHAPAHRRGAGRGLARRPGRGRRDQRGAGRHPRAAVGRRAAAVRRRPPRPGRPHPRRGRRRAGAGALRGGVRRRGDPGRDRLGAGAVAAVQV